MRHTSFVKDIKTSQAKKQKVMGETSSAYQMSRRSETCETDATLSPANALTSADAKLQKTISRELCVELLSFYCQPPMSGVQLIRDVEPKKSDAENVVHTVEDFFKKAAAEETLPTDPAPVATWMGSFMLKNEKTSMGFRAQTTSQGLPKVKEFSEKMPEVLEFDLCPYKDVLWTVFKGYDPDDEDIGLYFFPDNMERSMAYISHLEKLSEQFCMRSCVDGVELLVFTSKVLHKDYRIRNKADFLWGIYRRRHGKLEGAVEEMMVVDTDNVVDMDTDTEDFDMEVDMVGGEIIGRVDVVVPRQSIETSYGMCEAEANAVILPASNSISTSVPADIDDIPPGFSLSMRGQWMNISPSFGDSASGKQIDPPPGFIAPMKIKEEVL